MANVCECQDPQSMHKASKYGCRNPDCGCAKYVFDPDATRTAFSEPTKLEETTVVVEPGPVPRGVQAGSWLAEEVGIAPEPGGESTSAALLAIREELGAAIDVGARLNTALFVCEQERDEARAALADVEGHRQLGEKRLTAAERERDEALGEIRALTTELTQANAQIDELSTEADNLRLTRNAAESQLGELRQVIEAIEDDRPAPATGGVIDSYTRWFCQPVTGCGEQYDLEQDDNYCSCGKQLLAVAITATLNQGAPTA